MRDTRIEKFLVKRGVGFEYCPSIPLAQCRVDPEAKLNIRLAQQLSEERVERYALAMKDGDEFPAIVLYRDRKGQYFFFVNGLHRFAALGRVGATEVDAYILLLDPDERSTINHLRRTINLLEGLAPTAEESLEQAVQDVDEGSSQADAAREHRIPLSRLHNRLANREVESRLLRVRLNPTQIPHLQDTHKRQLGRIKRDDDFFQAVMLAQEARLTVDQTKELLNAIEAPNSNSTEVIAQWRKDLAPAIRESAGGKLKPAASAIRNYLNRLAWISRERTRVQKSARALGPVELKTALRRVDEFLVEIHSFRDDLLKAIEDAEKTQEVQV